MRPGRLLAFKPGVNPNSSSLGVDVSFLLLGAGVIGLGGLLLSTWLAARGRRAAGQEPPADPP